MQLWMERKEALSCMSAAIHKVLADKWGHDILQDCAKINIRLHNYPESIIALKNLKAAYIGTSKFQLKISSLPPNLMLASA
ncbi:DNA replication licensing factor mcm8 [Sarracenia purpurea var. burkii]